MVSDSQAKMTGTTRVMQQEKKGILRIKKIPDLLRSPTWMILGEIV